MAPARPGLCTAACFPSLPLPAALCRALLLSTFLCLSMSSESPCRPAYIQYETVLIAMLYILYTIMHARTHVLWQRLLRHLKAVITAFPCVSLPFLAVPLRWQDDLRDVVVALDLARTVFRRIRLNFVWCVRAGGRWPGGRAVKCGHAVLCYAGRAGQGRAVTAACHCLQLP
eukprot:SAG22_NODE_465_length_10181_cov_6.604444_3_plen_172_part_00